MYGGGPSHSLIREACVPKCSLSDCKRGLTVIGHVSDIAEAGEVAGGAVKSAVNRSGLEGLERVWAARNGKVSRSGSREIEPGFYRIDPIMLVGHATSPHKGDVW